MLKTGLDIIAEMLPVSFKGNRIGVLCHAPSITHDFIHITTILKGSKECYLAAVFGPQHGLFGQTQDNMIEWQSNTDPFLKVPVYSLYGEHRKPTPSMLEGIDLFLIDLQDVGARLYTYIWTIKLCMEACSEAGIPVWILDRPNPIGRVAFDGPVLKEEFFSFVGGASIPLCHRMTIGEMAVWIKSAYINSCELNVVWMEGWRRNTMFSDTGLPWVFPSPNMPTLQTAVVYPGMVLAEALNISEGRGTTIPFELIGAPFIDPYALKKNLDSRRITGCVFRIHNFIPTFNKFANQYCYGIQTHVTNLDTFYPVRTALEVFDAIIETSPSGSMIFNPPPYEYEYTLMPFDILSGDEGMRTTLQKGGSIAAEKERWQPGIDSFISEFSQLRVYPD